MNRRKLFQLLGTLGAWSASPAQAHRDFLKIDTAFAIPRLEDAWNMSDGNSSVSYTHLDVYKRQALLTSSNTPGLIFGGSNGWVVLTTRTLESHSRSRCA